MSRNKIEIDWKKVDDLLMAGCTIVEIAGYFGCDRDTLYIRFEKEFGSALSAYAEEKRQKGQSILRAHQYAKALGLTDKGDNTLLIWLGKTRLNQREVDNSQVPPKDNEIDKENNQMEENHKLRQRIAELEAKFDNQSETRSEL